MNTGIIILPPHLPPPKKKENSSLLLCFLILLFSLFQVKNIENVCITNKLAYFMKNKLTN